VPEGDACVPLPPAGAPLDAADPLAAAPGAHRSPRRGWETYEQIPRRPDRPAEVSKYLLPIGSPEHVPEVLSGYDLDRPAAEQRHGAAFHDTGHGGIDLSGERGEPVKVVALEHQEGDAEVVYVGDLFGTTVVTQHLVRESGRLRAYVVLYGHLDHAPGELTPGAHVKAGDVVGFVGDTGSPGIVHLHLEVRQVRDGVDLAKVAPRRLVEQSVSVVCDPRNVLPLR
jgi:murein DD-endopeptidase MepM/ murein hydrolase activator NlpD